jgi:hypothetical protein
MADRQKPRFSKERWGFYFFYSKGAKAMSKKIESKETFSSIMKKRFFILFVAALLFCGLAGMARAALVDRGGGLIYDNVLNITWLQDANYGAGSSYDDHTTSTDGRMTWGNAVAWATQLSYAGFTGWRLPNAYNQDGSGPNLGGNVSGSELGHMYYNNLGGVWNDPVLLNPTFIDGNGKTVSFQNMQSYSYYWFMTEFDSDKAWLYQLNAGSQLTNSKNDGYYAWAVHDGDIGATPVPLPSAIWLFGSVWPESWGL